MDEEYIALTSTAHDTQPNECVAVGEIGKECQRGRKIKLSHVFKYVIKHSMLKHNQICTTNHETQTVAFYMHKFAKPPI